MAYSKSSIQTPAASFLGKETAVSSTASLFKSGSTVFHTIDVDNTANSVAVFVKLYNHASPTVGTTDPQMVFKLPASVRRTMLIPGGHTFGTAVSVACVTTGGTAGTTSPKESVVARILFT